MCEDKDCDCKSKHYGKHHHYHWHRKGYTSIVKELKMK